MWIFNLISSRPRRADVIPRQLSIRESRPGEKVSADAVVKNSTEVHPCRRLFVGKVSYATENFEPVVEAVSDIQGVINFGFDLIERQFLRLHVSKDFRTPYLSDVPAKLPIGDIINRA